METQVGKWGNSLALRIPKGLADEAGLKDGGKVEVSLDQGAVSDQAVSYLLLLGGTDCGHHRGEPSPGDCLG